ncbi:hypothetical protein L3X38_020984 [Prunus dulcis]|uniref:Uncharacterized protein n=1 Tax=Prunus dulcis TaxID=3755 RepID=A0AAD4VTE6_PRUDU|nr:hypothetical protein L3X38_020984 [Prunus dulcis]
MPRTWEHYHRHHCHECQHEDEDGGGCRQLDPGNLNPHSALEFEGEEGMESGLGLDVYRIVNRYPCGYSDQHELEVDGL